MGRANSRLGIADVISSCRVRQGGALQVPCCRLPSVAKKMGACLRKPATADQRDGDKEYDSEYGPHHAEISKPTRINNKVVQDSKEGADKSQPADGKDIEDGTYVQNKPMPNMSCGQTARKGDLVKTHLANIVSRIKNEPVENINPRESSKIFFENVHAYLDCREQMDIRYNEIDELQQLARFDLDDDSGGLQDESGDYKIQYLQQSTSGEMVKNITEVYEAAEKALPVFQSVIEKNLEKAWWETASDENSGDETDFKLPDPPLKGQERAVEKANDDYSERVPGPAIAYLYDIVRGCVSFTSKSEMVTFLSMLKEDPSVHIVKVKNRFRNPTLTGYRDFNLVIQLDIDDTFKHICEIQLHHKGIQDLDKKLKTHIYYEYFRKYYAGATGSLEDRLEDLELIGVGLDTHVMADLLSECTDVERLQRLATLFDDYLGEPKLALKVYAKLFELASSEDSVATHRSKHVLYIRMAKVLHEQGDLNNALFLFRNSALTVLPELDLLAECYSSIGRVYKDQGRLDWAWNMLHKALSTSTMVYGAESTHVATVHMDGGRVAMLQGQLDRAQEYFEKALDTYVRVYGENSEQAAVSLVDIGRVAVDQGRLADALQLFEKALAIHIGVYGTENKKVAIIYSELGRVARDQKEYGYAKEMFEKALAIDRQVFGNNSPAVAISYTDLGRIARDENQLEHANEMFDKALTINRHWYGDNHPKVAMSLDDIDRVSSRQLAKEVFQTADIVDDT